MRTSLKVLHVFILMSLAFLSGCAGLNVSLLPETKPLEEYTLEGTGKPKILLLDLDGTISFKDESEGLLVKRPSKVAFFREALLKAEEDPEVAGVIIKINSPGGTVAASDAIYHELMSFREKKKIPVYAYIMEVGASGAYYVACSADRIIAGPAAITGSIGVIAMKINIEGLLSKIGVSDETYKSGPKKDFWSPFRPSTPEERKMLQEIIDNLYSRFLEVVRSNRKNLLDETHLRSLADGRVMTAGDAASSRLIDRVAYLDQTVEAMKKDLNAGTARLITYKRPKTFKSNIYSEMPVTPHVINLISINSEELSLVSGVQFMYLWSP